MNEQFATMLAEDGKKNSLGRVDDVIQLVIADKSRLEELYKTVFHDDAWVRMRAIDAFEKICRQHPEWVGEYIDKIQNELSGSTQSSIRWHIAQIYSQVELDDKQKDRAINWLKEMLSSKDVDWIVASNCMATLAVFVRRGDADKTDLLRTIAIQKGHKSNAVIKRANKLQAEFS